MREAPLEEVGKRIKELREKKGLSQSDLARKVDISTSYLSRIESAECNPSFRIMSKLSRALAGKNFWIEEAPEEDG